MLIRLKLCFKLLTCKKFVFSDCKFRYTHDINTHDAINLSNYLINICEKTVIEEKLLQEVKEILNDH